MKNHILIVVLFLKVVMLHATDCYVANASPLRVIIKDNLVRLSWSTSEEKNNRGFEIQKSYDGIYWYKIGWKQGHKEAIGVSYYVFVDKKPCSGTNYYRCKQKDFCGNFSFSKVAVVNFHQSQIRLYPHPVTKTVTIVDDSGCPIKAVGIYNDSGRKVMFTKPQNGKIDLESLPEGMYILQVETENGVVIERLLVE